MTYEEAIEWFESVVPYYDDEEEAITIAIECIKKQMPKKPTDVYKERDTGYTREWTCPNCGNVHRSRDWINCISAVCEECYQRIDWSEE